MYPISSTKEFDDDTPAYAPLHSYHYFDLTIIPRNCSGLLVPLSPDINRTRLLLSATNLCNARSGPIGKINEALPQLLVPLKIMKGVGRVIVHD